MYPVISMKINDILKKVVLVGLFAVPFIPLLVSNSMFFPFITGKNFAFRIIVEIILAAWVILALRDSFYRPKKSIILIALTAFIGILAMADFFGENPYRSFWSNYERMEGLVAHLHLFAYFLVTAAMLSTERLWQKFFYTSFGVNTAIIGYSLFQLSGKLAINQGGVRLDATFGNATYLAAYALFQVFLIAFYLIRQNKNFSDSSSDKAAFVILGASLGAFLAMPPGSSVTAYFLIVLLTIAVDIALFFAVTARESKPFLWALLIANLFVLYNTETRGAILGLIGGVFVSAVILAIGNWKNAKVRNTAVSAIVVLLVFVGLFVAFKDSKFIKERSTLARFASISLTEQTTISRFTVWDMSWQGFKEHPVLGWGQDNFIVVFSKYYKPDMWNQEPWFDRSHNVFFDWMIAAGLLGILAYLALFGAGLYSLWRSLKLSFTEKSVLTGLLVGYFFQNLFVFDNLTSYIMFFSVLGFISFASVNDGVAEKSAEKPTKAREPKNVPPEPDGAGYFGAAMALIVLVPVLYFGNVKPILASRHLIQAISGQKEGPAKNMEYFKKIFALGTFGSGEAREQLVRATISLRGANIPDDFKQAFFSLSNEQMLAQIKMAPTDARYELYFGLLLGSFGNFDESANHLKKALELSPKKQQILFELGSVYLSKGDADTANKYFKEAYDEAPKYPDAAITYATGLIYAGQVEEADKVLVSSFGTTLVPDNRIISAYFAKGMPGRVIDIRKNQLLKLPKDQQTMLALAAAYLNAGERENAVKELNEIIKAYPDFKNQGESFIKEIRAGRNP